MVPVLSSRITSISPAFWIASPVFIRIPRRAARPLPVTRAMGVARPRAQGQAMTRVATKTKTAVETGSVTVTQGITEAAASRKGTKAGKKKYQIRAAARAREKTTGMNTAATRSAAAWMGTRDDWASSMSFTIRARYPSLEGCSTSISRSPVCSTVPPMTPSFSSHIRGTGSPLIIDSSTAPRPLRIRPSKGIRSPVRTRIRIPGFTPSTGRGAGSPWSFSTVASLICRAIRARISRLARYLSRASMYRPVRWKPISMAARAPKDLISRPARAKGAVIQAETAPRLTRGSMLA